ncbi:hypothetical protein DPMN_090348 [Dreissena polymorpha]|uniref:Uncharacterized protein n=1 Tax=Dreissena polymorpha TaxID=45954 RepID=A0A9D4QYZ5_DREPO|nr:hypothetical protein DPMN_090348 [Dreissena polymorpha]
MAKQDDQADPLFETLTTQKWRNRFLAGKKTLSLTHSRHYLNVLGCQMLASSN